MSNFNLPESAKDRLIEELTAKVKCLENNLHISTETERLALARLNLLLDKIQYIDVDGWATAILDWRVEVYSLSPETLLEAIDGEIREIAKLKR